jgi:hypothetical protein
VEFSKKLLYFSWAVTIVLTTILVLFSIKMLALDGIVTAVSLSWAETATATGFYYWKSKNENRTKYGQMFLSEYSDKWSPEVALRMAEIVLKD